MLKFSTASFSVAWASRISFSRRSMSFFASFFIHLMWVSRSWGVTPVFLTRSKKASLRCSSSFPAKYSLYRLVFSSISLMPATQSSLMISISSSVLHFAMVFGNCTSRTYLYISGPCGVFRPFQRLIRSIRSPLDCRLSFIISSVIVINHLRYSTKI